MELVSFRVRNFRSIADSGDISVAKLTSLVGRNESGKSNLLLALFSLNPAGGRKELQSIKDFPRGRRLEECKPETSVVGAWFNLSSGETAQIATILPGTEVKQISLGRGYSAKLWVDLGVETPTLNGKMVSGILRRLGPVLSPKWQGLDDPHKTNCENAWTALQAVKQEDPKAWAAAVKPAAATLRQGLGAASIMLDESQDDMLAELEGSADRIGGFDEASNKACGLVTSWLPLFIYISDFPELYGQQNLDRFVTKRRQDPTLVERDDNFEKLAKVADFDPAYLASHRDDHETRSQLLNRAGSLVTGEIRRLWKDRQLMIRFNLDGPHLDVLVSDPNAAYPVEVNLDERSRGFRWFFAFYITFSADTQGGKAEGAILLLDEPGLYLHAKSQEHLLKHLREDYSKNQIIYTTHSPFMVPPDAIDIVRTVNIDPIAGTTVTDIPSGDSRTLFPLQAALGYHLSQTLFVGHSNLVVEGVTDFWILSAVRSHFTDNGTLSLPEELTITPVGGAGKVSYMAALLASEKTTVLVLLDDDRAGRETQKELVTSKLLRDTAVMFVTEGFDPKPAEADIEDLIDPTVYGDLTRKTYAKELKGKKLELNDKIPRIVKRYEQAFQAVGLEFYKTRPAREFISRMGNDPSSVLTPDSAKRFEAIFNVVRERYERLKGRGAFT